MVTFLFSEPEHGPVRAGPPKLNTVYGMAVESNVYKWPSVLISPIVTLASNTCISWQSDCDNCSSGSQLSFKVQGHGELKDSLIHLANTFYGFHQVSLPVGKLQILFYGNTPSGELSIHNLRHTFGECKGECKSLFLALYFFSYVCKE